MPSSIVRLPDPLPSSMARAAFVARFADIYEHSPWIPEGLWDQGLPSACDTVDGLHDGLRRVLAAAGRDLKLALIRAHPDLAGKAALRGELTASSTSEQAGAGLDQCSAEEYERFQDLNRRYKERFGFPFIIAVKGLDRAAILEAFDKRIDNTEDAEFDEALAQIDHIARLRLDAMAVEGS